MVQTSVAATRDQGEVQRITILRKARLGSAGCVALTVLLWTAIPALRGHDLGILAAAGALVSVPHGAVDYLLPQSGRRRQRASQQLRLTVTYVAAFAIAVAILFIAPVVAYFGIVVLAVFHWGTGDAQFEREASGNPPALGGIVEVIAYGGVIIAAPEVVQQNAVQHMLQRIAPQMAAQARVPMLAVCYAILVMVALFLATHLARRQWIPAGEMALLVALGTLVPPGVAAGVYLGAWHAVRQTARLVADAKVRETTAAHPGMQGLSANSLSANGLSANGLGVEAIAAKRLGADELGAAGVDRARLLRIMIIGTVATIVLAAALVLVLALVHNASGWAGSHAFRLGDWMIVLITGLVAPHVATVLRYDLWKIKRIAVSRAPFQLGKPVTTP